MRVDHVSMVGMAAAVRAAGFVVTTTAGATGHARVHLDGTYLELSTPPASAGRDDLLVRGWFICPDDIEQAAIRLGELGWAASGPSRYEGADGTWLDLELDAAELGRATPRLTQRVDGIAEPWPPALGGAHPNGVRRLREIHLRTDQPAALARLLSVLDAAEVSEGRFALDEIVIAVHPGRREASGLSRLVFDAGRDLVF